MPADRTMKGSFELQLSVRTDRIARDFLLYLMALSCVASLTVAAQNSARNPRSWSGILVSSSCNADEAFFESPECNKVVPGAKLSLYDDTNRVMYDLSPQDKIAFHAGDTVTVRGTVDGDLIRIASIEPMSIGLALGQKAPPFALRAQSGRVETLETLKGSNGTVLLFFRSADW
jgi:hypothetical protein